MHNDFMWAYHFSLVYSNNHDRADSRFVPSQWDTALLCNDVSDWLGASLESALYDIGCMMIMAIIQHDSECYGCFRPGNATELVLIYWIFQRRKASISKWLTLQVYTGGF